MTSPAAPLRSPSALQDALAWLGTPPATDALRDLTPMRRHLIAIAEVGIPALQYAKILELFEARAALTAAAVKPLLLDATLPIAKRLRTVAQGLMQVHEALASGYLRVLRETPSRALHDEAGLLDGLCAAGLASLERQYEIAQFVASPAPQDFWIRAEAFYRLATSTPSTDSAQGPTESAALLRLGTLLALAAAQPEGFSPREIAFLAEYLRRHPGAVEIRGTAASPSDSDFWLLGIRGFAPTAAVRRRAPPDATLHFRCVELAARAREDLSRIERGDPVASIGLPQEAALTDYCDVLSRAAEHWERPRSRSTQRRRQGYRVQVCTSLGSLWQHADPASVSAEIEFAASEWMIVNESANGYAIMHVAGELSGLVAGSAIGLRPAADKPWSICLVRWARSDNPEHIELGLELVAPAARAVRIARRADTEDGAPHTAPQPALLLPPLPAVKRAEALLTTRGTFAPGLFTLLSESAGRIQVADCTGSHLLMHTACVEIFEFERLRTPAGD